MATIMSLDNRKKWSNKIMIVGVTSNPVIQVHVSKTVPGMLLALKQIIFNRNMILKILS